MAHRSFVSADRFASCAIVWLVFSIGAAAQISTSQSAALNPNVAAGTHAESAPFGSASVGQALFLGTRRFVNGGPACVSCHRTAGIPFPNGGTLGPDLSGIYQRFGPEALQTILQTLYFPTMAPIFDKRPLTAQEQNDLGAFFQQTSAQPPPAHLAPRILVPAVAGFLALVAITGVIWRNRLRRVRKNLVEQIQSSEEVRS